MLGVLIHSLAALAALFRLDPTIDKFLQNVQRYSAVRQDNFMKLPNIEFSSELSLCFFTELENFQHTDFVGGRLTRHDDVAIDRIDAIALLIRGVLYEIVNRLLARPPLR